jgi:hypothetical protein
LQNSSANGLSAPATSKASSSNSVHTAQCRIVSCNARVRAHTHADRHTMHDPARRRIHNSRAHVHTQRKRASERERERENRLCAHAGCCNQRRLSCMPRSVALGGLRGITGPSLP